MLYPAALTSALLSPAALALPYVASSGSVAASGARLEVGELAEVLLGALPPAYGNEAGTKAVRLVAEAINVLAESRVRRGIKSETRGARSVTYADVPDALPAWLVSAFAALVDPPLPSPVASGLDPARYLRVGSLR